MLSAIMLSAIMLSAILLSAIMLNVIMLSTIMLNVIMLIVVAPGPWLANTSDNLGSSGQKPFGFKITQLPLW